MYVNHVHLRKAVLTNTWEDAGLTWAPPLATPTTADGTWWSRRQAGGGMPRSVNSEAASFPSLTATKGIIQCNFKNIINFLFSF